MPAISAMDRRQRAKLRRACRPARVGLLFVGESPPASGRFFYCGDSGLYRAMRDAFGAAGLSREDETFLAAFQSAGCYLVDLCPEPVDRLDRVSRRAACQASEKSLARTIAQLQPTMVATLLRSIEPNVARAAAMAGWRGPFLHLPYPGRWSRFRDAFLETLLPVLKKWLPSERQAAVIRARPA